MPEVLNVIEILFLRQEVGCPVPLRRIPWRREYEITAQELSAAVKRMAGRRTAPGLDGLTCAVWARVMSVAPSLVRRCFNNCLRRSDFPQVWRRARLVLVAKSGAQLSYRPLCLLDELGKLFERIVADRIEEYISRRGSLSPYQFGFRTGLSTCDAIARMRTEVESHTCQGKVCVAVGLDVKNAFNTLAWDAIRRAAREWGLPTYLRWKHTLVTGQWSSLVGTAE